MANTIEALKAAKDGLDVLADLYRYAADPSLEVAPDDQERLKWYGLFHRRTTPGRYMLRMRIPNGVLSSEQAEAVGRLANEFGGGRADLTTRQNLQLRDIALRDAPAILQRLYASGLTAQQSGMDNVRNIVGCPLAGLDPDAPIDARPLAVRMQQAIIGHKGFSNLPRKFNISISGCRDDCGHAQTHDLGFTPATRDGAPGFNVTVGGALGGADPMLGQPLDVFVTPPAVVELTLAILRVFRDRGPRVSRKQARLKVLLREIGPEALRAAVERECRGPLPPAGASLLRRQGGDHIGVATFPPDGLNVVGVVVPVGRICGDDLIEFARLAREFGQGELRLTTQQNVLIPRVDPGNLQALLAEPLLQRFSPDPSPWLRGLVACTGIDYCHYSLIDTKAEALALSEALAHRYAIDRPVRLHWSGCPHACGQHKIADVGFQGARIRAAGGGLVAGATIVAGGKLGASPSLAVARAGKQPTADLPEIVVSELAALFGPDSITPIELVEDPA